MKTTLLYGFAPQGVGTGQVEHLQSHLLSLAYEHCLSAKKMVDRVLHPLHRNHSHRVNTTYGWSTSHGRFMLGIDNRTEDWICAMEYATGRTDLTNSTLFPLGNVINGEHLLSGTLQHCHLCFQSDIDCGKRPYRRLLWQVKHVQCCPIHHIGLVESTCGAFANDRVTPSRRVNLGGVCPGCGSIGYKCLPIVDLTASTSQIWTSVQIQDALAHLSLIANADLTSVKASISSYAKNSDSLNQIALQAGISKSALWRWIHFPKAKMSLGHSLKVAAATGISLVGFLTGDLMRADIVVEIDIERARKRHKEVNLGDLHKRLQQAIETPTTLKKVADEFEVSTEFVRRHFPELAAEMIKLFADVKSEDLWTVRKKVFQEVESVLLTLCSQNQPLTIRNAGLVSGVIWFPTSLQARIFNELRTALGWKTLGNPETLEFGPPMKFRINNSKQRLRNATEQAKGEL